MAPWVGQEGGECGKAFPLAVWPGSFSENERDVDISVFTAGVVVLMGGDRAGSSTWLGTQGLLGKDTIQ